MVRADRDERRSRSPGSHFSSSLGGSLSLITSPVRTHGHTYALIHLLFPKLNSARRGIERRLWLTSCIDGKQKFVARSSSSCSGAERILALSHFKVWFHGKQELTLNVLEFEVKIETQSRTLLCRSLVLEFPTNKHIFPHD